jgi:RNA polymerase sigma-70 factor (ECF subfamily)
VLSAFSPDDDEDHDPLETLAADVDQNGPRTPESQLLQAQTLNTIDDEIKKLPARQREAFLMRYWEDMDVAETAAAMGCSEGSVKTHCSRATHALAAALSARGIKL